MELERGAIFAVSLSPDGRWIAYGRPKGEFKQQTREIAIVSIEGGPPMHTLSPPSPNSFLLGWSPDSQSLLMGDGALAQNLYQLPLAGGAPVQMTHFDSEPLWITAAAYSRDGKKIAITRQRANTTDAVLFTGFR